MHRAALRSALSVKAGAGQIVVVDGLQMSEAKTKQAVQMFKALGVSDQNVLFVVAERETNLDRSVRNLSTVKLIQSGYLNVRDLLGYDVLVMAKDAVEWVEVWLGTDAAPTDDSADLVATGTEE
jgi:large subunit ribosomal protein L4